MSINYVRPRITLEYTCPGCGKDFRDSFELEASIEHKVCDDCYADIDILLPEINNNLARQIR